MGENFPRILSHNKHGQLQFGWPHSQNHNPRSNNDRGQNASDCNIEQDDVVFPDALAHPRTVMIQLLITTSDASTPSDSMHYSDRSGTHNGDDPLHICLLFTHSRRVNCTHCS